MRDGARPAADVYRPAEQDRPVEDRFPVIGDRTPYRKNGPAEESFFCTWRRRDPRTGLPRSLRVRGKFLHL